MGKVTVTDNSGKFIDENAKAIDRVLGVAAIDIERLSKMQVPHDTGRLQSSGHHSKIGLMKYHISYNTPYARRWEFETPPNGFREGRKSRYLRDPAELVASQLKDRLRVELRNIRV